MPGRVLMLTRYMRSGLLSENAACKSRYEQLVKDGVGWGGGEIHFQFTSVSLEPEDRRGLSLRDNSTDCTRDSKVHLRQQTVSLCNINFPWTDRLYL